MILIKGIFQHFSNELDQLINKRNIPSTISEIETYVEQSEQAENNTGMLIYNFPPDAQRSLMKLSKNLEVTLHIPVAQFKKILDMVRTTILDWTLKLEEEGVLGEGMTFSEKDKEKAIASTTSIVNNIGSMVNSQLQQNTQDSQQSLVVEEFKIENLASLIPDLKKLQEELKDPEQKQELASEIAVLETQVTSPKPKNGIIRETLKSVRNIAEGTTGSLIATGIQAKITLLLAVIG